MGWKSMPSLRSIAVLFVGWSAMGLLFALPELQARNGGAWPLILQSSLASWWAWGLIALLIVAMDRRLPVPERRVGLRLLCHLPLSVVLTVLYLYVVAALRATFGIGAWSAVADSALLIRGLQGMILWSLLVYWLILGGYLARQYYERYVSSELRVERLERLSVEARLHVLRLQLDPHFLFNALNTISSQVESDPKLARSMIEHLGDLLRMSLGTHQKQHVPLASELAFLDHYLAIQKIRFGNRLRYEQTVAETAKNAMVPSMMLQPLVENAIRHGISSRAAGGTVQVIVGVVDSELRIRVEDDGVGLPAGWDPERPADGLGLSVTRQRLEGFFPDGKSSIEIQPRAEGSGGVAVKLRMPLIYA
jgi:two-component system LytT family sensor kinase